MRKRHPVPGTPDHIGTHLCHNRCRRSNIPSHLQFDVLLPFAPKLLHGGSWRPPRRPFAYRSFCFFVFGEQIFCLGKDYIDISGTIKHIQGCCPMSDKDRGVSGFHFTQSGRTYADTGGKNRLRFIPPQPLIPQPGQTGPHYLMATHLARFAVSPICITHCRLLLAGAMSTFESISHSCSGLWHRRKTVVAAFKSVGSSDLIPGYHLQKVLRRSPFKTCTLVCNNRCAAPLQFEFQIC